MCERDQSRASMLHAVAELVMTIRYDQPCAWLRRCLGTFIDEARSAGLESGRSRRLESPH